VRLVSLVLAAALALPVRAARADDADLAPQDAIGYRNGHKFTIQVVQISYSLVEVHTAFAFLAMQSAAAEDGVQLWIRSGFRSWDEQQWFYDAWKAGWGNKAARPGFSNHQMGTALDLDLDDPNAYDWMVAHGKTYGFKRTVRTEPWHWEYKKPPRKKARRKHHH
jgi:LAS superfamily LD-carboxypeptidase LdcB